VVIQEPQLLINIPLSQFSIRHIVGLFLFQKDFPPPVFLANRLESSFGVRRRNPQFHRDVVPGLFLDLQILEMWVIPPPNDVIFLDQIDLESNQLI
jgi:hypothetical protein